ncbi:MAG: rhodanese-like domain-containing protein [Gammaproteobacteria bacterium]|nr:rhodanese-like domain-containing protein [Gammaproteobacteria bacterium]
MVTVALRLASAISASSPKVSPTPSSASLMPSRLSGVSRVTADAARKILSQGGRWLDVRLPSEHQNLAIEGALNVPLYLIRLKLSTLDRNKPYVVYCDTGRRSSAAAYILVERGFDAYVLQGGMGAAGGLQLTRGGGADKP